MTFGIDQSLIMSKKLNLLINNAFYFLIPFKNVKKTVF